jgi:hypothetical protein
MYDVIGNVVDANDVAIKDVVVSDGKQQIKTDADGYYEIKTTSRTLTFNANNYKPNTFNLGKYKLGAKVNADITLDGLSPINKMNFFQKNKKTIMYVGIGLAVLVGGYFVYKKIR